MRSIKFGKTSIPFKKTMIIFGLLFSIFVVIFGNNARKETKKAVSEQAKVIAESLWVLEPKMHAKYLAEVTRAYGYAQLTVVDNVDELFYEIKSPAPNKLEKSLVLLKLIPILNFASDIYYEERYIGKISVDWRCKVIYTYTYISLLFGLIILIVRLYNNIVTTNRSLEDRVQKRTKELQQSEERYRTLFSSVNEGVSLHNIAYNQKGQPVDYRILEVNPAYGVILGIKPEESAGRMASQLYGTGKPPPYLDIFSKVAETGDPVSFDTFFAPMEKHFKVSVFSPGKGQFATLFADVTEQKKAEEQIKVSLLEKETLLNEIHHRVKNNMQVISSLLKIQSEKIEDEQYANMFKESQGRIKAMALVHEKLYRSESIADIDFKGYANSLVTSLFRSYGARPDKIVVKIEAEDVSLGLEVAIPCGLIINELVSNSLKYAFPKDGEGEIRVTLFSINENELALEVSDNGIGIAQELDIKNTDSMGLHLVTILSENQLEGTIELNRVNGTNFHIRFKKRVYKARI